MASLERTSLAFEVVFSSLGERKLGTLTVTNLAVMVVVLLCCVLSIPVPIITDHSFEDYLWLHIWSGFVVILW